MPGPVTDARPGNRPTQSRVGPGGHRAPTSATPPAGVGDPGCDWCGGAGRLVAMPVEGRVVEEDAVPVWCYCTRRVQLVLRAARLYLDAQGQAPTLRELARCSGLSLYATQLAVDRLEAGGFVERPRGPVKRQPRALRLIRDGEPR